MRQYIDTVQDSHGNALQNIAVEVLDYFTGSLATIYSDNGSTVVPSSRVNSDVTGQFNFFANDSYYTLRFYYKGNLYKTQSPVSINDYSVAAMGTTAGTSTAYTLSSRPFPLQLFAGLTVRAKIHTQNGASPTLNVNGTGAKSIVLSNGATIAGGELPSGAVAMMTYDGTNWVLSSPAPFPPNLITTAETNAGVTPTKYLELERYLRRYNATSGTGLSQAVSVAGQYANAVVYLDKAVALTSNLTVPANVTLRFDKGALITVSANITLTINGYIDAPPTQIFNCSASGALVNGSIKNPRLYTEWWGAVGDGSTDDLSPIQKTIKAAMDAGYIGVQFLAKTYKVSATIQGNGDSTGSFYAPNLYGIEKRKTTIQCTGLGSGVAILKYIGGSGQPSGSYVADIGFSGDANSVAIEFAGKNGMQAKRCLFGANLVGVRFHNEVSSTFTEYCVANNCEFLTTCLFCVQYKRTSGDASFHGSGLVNRCLINRTTAGGSQDAILVDATCQPYNAPVDCQIWSNKNIALIQNNSALACSFHFGTITVECFSAAIISLGSVNPVYYAGPYEINGESAAGGTAVHCRAVVVNTDGSITPLGFRRAYQLAMTTGANTLTSKVPAGHRLVYVRFLATNYDYRYLLTVDHEGGGAAGFVTTIATIRTLNTAGYGAPTFSVSTAGNLIATNAGFPASGVTAYWEELGIFPGLAGGKQQTV